MSHSLGRFHPLRPRTATLPQRVRGRPAAVHTRPYPHFRRNPSREPLADDFYPQFPRTYYCCTWLRCMYLNRAVAVEEPTVRMCGTS